MTQKRQLLCTLGKMDIPSIQEQPYFKVDLLQSNVLLIGSSGSGKSNFLKVLIAEIHRQIESLDMNEQIYILDSADDLRDYKDLPLVVAQYDFSNEEYIKRVFYQIQNQYIENVKAINGVQFNSLDAKKTIPHTTLIIDNINSFLGVKHNEKYLETLIKLARDGLTKGITIVMTGSSTKGITTIMSYFSQKIALNLSKEEYLTFFSRKVVGSRNVLGGGYGNVTYNASNSTEKRTYSFNQPYELQVFLMDRELLFSDRQVEMLSRKRARERLTRFPLVLKESNYKSYLIATNDNEDADEKDVVIGVEYTKCVAIKTQFSTSRVTAVYGKKNDEKPLMWERLLKNFNKNGYTYIIIDDARGKVENIKKKYGVDDKYYFYKRDSVWLQDKKEEEKQFKLSVLQQFVAFIHENLYGLKDIQRAISSKTPVLTSIIPGYNPEQNEDKTIEHCVFVLQAKELFANSIHANIFWGDIFPYLLSAAEEYDWYFIFTDARIIPNMDIQNLFNQCLNSIILLDDIVEFVSDRGRRSVLGDMDVNDLKDQFGLCEENDAYFYQIDTAELCKIKCVWEDE